MTPFRRHTTAVACALGAALALSAAPASAQVITSVASAAVAIVGAAPTPIATTSSFGLAAGTRIAVSFSAACSVASPVLNNGYTDIDIVVQQFSPGPGWVDWTTLIPTAGFSGRFCSANTTVGYDGFVSAAAETASPPVPAAGTYRVQVRARANAPATGAAYMDRSLVVSR